MKKRKNKRKVSKITLILIAFIWIVAFVFTLIFVSDSIKKSSKLKKLVQLSLFQMDFIMLEAKLIQEL